MSHGIRGPVVIVWRWRTAERVRTVQLEATALSLAPLTHAALLGSLAPLVEESTIARHSVLDCGGGATVVRGGGSVHSSVVWPRSLLLNVAACGISGDREHDDATTEEMGEEEEKEVVTSGLSRIDQGTANAFSRCAGRYVHRSALPFVGGAPLYVRSSDYDAEDDQAFETDDEKAVEVADDHVFENSDSDDPAALLMEKIAPEDAASCQRCADGKQQRTRSVRRFLFRCAIARSSNWGGENGESASTMNAVTSLNVARAPGSFLNSFFFVIQYD